MSDRKHAEISITSRDVIALYCELEGAAGRIWIDGGWAVDALLGKQLRPHKDLDVAIDWQDVPKLREILGAKGYRQVRQDSQWNFVLGDNEGHEIDAHAFVRDDEGNVVEGIMYPTASLTGIGSIDGHGVRCISPKHMVEFLAPWIHKWPEKYVAAVAALCENSVSRFRRSIESSEDEFVRLADQEAVGTQIGER